MNQQQGVRALISLFVFVFTHVWMYDSVRARLQFFFLSTNVMIIALVLGLISTSSSRALGSHPSSGLALHRSTSTPRYRGSSYSCAYVGYWQTAWSPAARSEASTR